jgi:hypothetical protein
MSAPVVTQADKRAAKDWDGCDPDRSIVAFRLAQAFARHRTAAEAASAAQIAELVEALGYATAVIAAHTPRDALGMNGDPETGMWPLLDEYLHHFRATLARHKSEVQP